MNSNHIDLHNYCSNNVNLYNFNLTDVSNRIDLHRSSGDINGFCDLYPKYIN